MKAFSTPHEELPPRRSSQKEAARPALVPPALAAQEHETVPVVRERGTYASSAEMAAGVAVFDDHLRYVQINEVLARINGLPVEEHLGRTLHEIVPHIAPVLEPLLKRIFETGEPALNVEIKSQRANVPGPPRHWLLSFIPVPGSDGRPQGVSVIALEVTNRGFLDHHHAAFSRSNPLDGHTSAATPRSEVPLDRQIRVLRDVSAALSTAAEILEQTQTSGVPQSLDISNGIDFYEEVRRFEDALIRRALKLTGGNQKKAASLLGIKPTTLHTILKRHGIEQD